METTAMQIVPSDGKIELREDIEDMVTKVRNTSKFFRHSPVSNDALQKCIKADHNKTHQMILDVKNRW